MTKKQKELLIGNLTNSFSKQNAIIICDYKGMSVEKLEKIRKEADKNSVNAILAKVFLIIFTLTLFLSASLRIFSNFSTLIPL